MKIYLCGAISNDKNYQYKFWSAALTYSLLRHEVINPVNITHGIDDWHKCMKICLSAMIDCDCVVVLDKKNIFGSYKIKSKGRDLELYVAKKLGIPIKHISEFIK